MRPASPGEAPEAGGRPEVWADPRELFGYVDPSDQPEATGVEKLVLKRGNLFLVANRLGDVAPAGARDLGLFLADTRHLSGWRMTLQGGPPLCLSSQVSPEYVAQIDFTVPGLREGDLLGKEPVNYVHLRRAQLIEDVFVDRLVLTNYQHRDVHQWLEMAWAADFADVFETRGAHRPRRGDYHPPAARDGRALLRYRGLDGRDYVTEVRAEVGEGEGEAGGAATLERLDGQGARVAFHLAPGQSAEVTFTVFAGTGEARSRYRLPFAARARESRRTYDEWAEGCTRFGSSHAAFDRALAQSVADLKALTVYHFGQPVISAGIPWYTCPFGRDALLAGFEAMLATPSVALQALRFLARLQGTRDDPTRDEEPGKVPHEIRFGEMAAAGEVPHTPYYGSVDATPLFPVLLSEYHRWTGDREALEELFPAAERALAWVERAADAQGFLAYQRRTPKGLLHQGWKDSHDGVPFASGEPAVPPIRLVEVQGYAVDARRGMAELYGALGRGAERDRLLAEAAALARCIEERFWMERQGTFALALDGRDRQVDAVTSNPGHLLFSGAASEARAEAVVASLLDSGLWSGWGIRTLARGQDAYNPLSYHNGTVWPHDNALAAFGMARYGKTAAAVRVLDGLWAAAQHFRDLRLPELFCGLEREPGQFPVHYPVACSPQAWASAAPFLLLRACLGLFPDAAGRVLRIASPALPAWLDHLTLQGLRVGASRVTLHFTRGASGTFVALGEVEGGPLDVRIELRR